MLKRKVTYAGILFAVLVVNILYVNYQPLMLLLVLLLFPALLWLYLLPVSKNITAELKLDRETAVRMERLSFEVILFNKIYLPAPNIMVEIEFEYGNCSQPATQTFLTNIKSGDKAVIEGVAALNYAGELTLRIKSLRMYDFLKLFDRKISCDCSETIVVLPQLVEPDYYTLSTEYIDFNDSQEYSQNRSGEDPSEIFDTRQYVEGDNVSRIHWKVSARIDELLVKEFSMPINKSNVLVAELLDDGTEEGRKNLDGVFEMIYAIGNLACLKEKSVFMAFYVVTTGNLEVEEVCSGEELAGTMRRLIGAKTYTEEPQALLSYAVSELADAGTLYYVTTQVTEQILETVNLVRGSDAYLYCMGDKADENAMSGLNDSLLIHANRDDIRQGLQTVMI